MFNFILTDKPRHHFNMPRFCLVCFTSKLLLCRRWHAINFCLCFSILSLAVVDTNHFIVCSHLAYSIYSSSLTKKTTTKYISHNGLKVCFFLILARSIKVNVLFCLEFDIWTLRAHIFLLIIILNVHVEMTLYGIIWNACTLSYM